MSEPIKYLCFDLGQEEFAIPLLSVKEVLALPDTTPVPQAPSHFVGIMNLRGSIVSILDLRLKLGYKSEKTEQASVIIMDIEGLNLGVVVDRVNSVIAFTQDQMSPRPETGLDRSANYITGVYRKSDKLIILLDLGRALSIEDRAAATKSFDQPKAA